MQTYEFVPARYEFIGLFSYENKEYIAVFM